MKSKNPKVTAAERERIAAEAPALASLREAYAHPLPRTDEHAEAAAARTKAWTRAWAITPALVQQHVHWLEAQVQELLRDRLELDLLRERLAAEAGAQTQGGKLGGRPSLLPANWPQVAAEIKAANAKKGPRRKRTRKQLDQDIADELNRRMRNTTVDTLITGTLVRDARRRDRKKDAGVQRNTPLREQQKNRET